MKHKFQYPGYIFLLLFILAVFSCRKQDDAQKEWGAPLIYMPQAAILNGGTNNQYPVPLFNNASTNNYTVDSAAGVLTIPLSVYRSGLQALNGYSVNIQAFPDTTNEIIAEAGIPDAVLLPADVYTLPENISVPSGKREAGFSLTIDLKKLIAEYPDYYFNKMVLEVGISDPSAYDLNMALSKTTVILDGKSFMPAP